MSEDSQEPKSQENESVSKIYHCPKCQTTHTVELSRSLSENKERYPFPYVFLHSLEEKLEELLTVLYIDANLDIRAVEIIEIENSNIFSENLAKEITEKLMNEIIVLQEENMELKGLLNRVELSDEVFVESGEDEETQEDLIEGNVIVDGEDESEGSFKQVSENVWKIKSKTPGRKNPPEGEKVILYFISTIGPGEKKQKLTINTGNIISDIKETIGNLYGLNPLNFHLSAGGVTLDEMRQLKDYKIKNGEDVLIIPLSMAGWFILYGDHQLGQNFSVFFKYFMIEYLKPFDYVVLKENIEDSKVLLEFHKKPKASKP